MTTFTKRQRVRRTHGPDTFIAPGEEFTVASVNLDELGDDWITLEGEGHRYLAEFFEPVEDTPAPLKPGQVWAATADPGETYRVIEVRDGDVWSENRYGDHIVLSASFFPNGLQLVTDATPAPLDLPKAKVGDTVTVMVDDDSIGPYEVKGEVRGHLGGTWSVGPINVASNGTWHEGVTLTAHQPTPDPEPESTFEPGTLADVTIRGERKRVERVVRVAPRDGSAHVWSTVPDNAWWDDEDVTGVRPLVVIDPAKVDVHALADLYEDKQSASNSRTAAMRAVLAELGGAERLAGTYLLPKPSDAELIHKTRVTLDSALDVEEMARTMCPHSHCDGSERSCPDHSVNIQRARLARAAILGGAS